MSERATWKPYIEDEAERAQLSALAQEIVVAVAGSPLASVNGEAMIDHALLRAYLGADDDAAARDLGGEALASAIGRLGTSPTGPGLYGGASKIGFAVAHLTAGDDADAVCAAIDRSLLQLLEDRTWPHYDLISGPVGYAVYAFERIDREEGHRLAGRILDELEHLAVPRGAGLAWFTPASSLIEWQREVAPQGYWNYGLAHGMPGVIGVLARCLQHGVDAPRARRLLDGAVAHLLDAVPPRDDGDGRYPGWVAEGQVNEHHSRRAAWCYGDLGVALGLASAAQVTGRDDWRGEALALALHVARCPVDQAGVFDAGLCHGGAGVAQCLARLGFGLDDAELVEAARTWLRRAVAMRRPDHLAGFPSALIEQGAVSFTDDVSFLTGAGGIALTLAAACSDVEPAWDRLLLADVG